MRKAKGVRTCKASEARALVSRDQPILPNRDTAIVIGVDVSLGFAWIPTADFEDLGLPTRIQVGKLRPDVEFRDRPVRCRYDILFKYEIGTLDMDFMVAGRGAQLRLVKGDRRLDLLQSQPLGRFAYNFAQGFDCGPARLTWSTAPFGPLHIIGTGGAPSDCRRCEANRSDRQHGRNCAIYQFGTEMLAERFGYPVERAGPQIERKILPGLIRSSRAVITLDKIKAAAVSLRPSKDSSACFSTSVHGRKSRRRQEPKAQLKL